MADAGETLALLKDPLAQELLTSRKMAQLAYTWTDGSPRVVPIWFHWVVSQSFLVARCGHPSWQR